MHFFFIFFSSPQYLLKPSSSFSALFHLGPWSLFHQGHLLLIFTSSILSFDLPYRAYLYLRNYFPVYLSLIPSICNYLWTSAECSCDITANVFLFIFCIDSNIILAKSFFPSPRWTDEYHNHLTCEKQKVNHPVFSI